MAWLALAGCLDLELPPTPADGGVGPDLHVLRPAPGDTISLSTPVEIDAASVNGVQSVTVTCGGAPSTGVFTWQVPPYTGLIDFTRCTLVTAGIDAGSGLGTLQLTFIAVDRLGNARQKSFDVTLDTSSASLFANLPARVLPRAPLQLQIGSDRPLLLPPTVRLAGVQADGVVELPGADGGVLYTVTFSQTPGIGVDGYAGDPQSPPIEVLLETEKAVSLAVDARALNQNPSHLEQAVLLSRVVWDRQVPGRVANAASPPVATAEGLQLALATVDATPTAASIWLPGLFRAQDGTFVAFDPAAVQAGSIPAGGFSLDAGWSATGFDGLGRTVFVHDAGTGSEVLFVDPPSGGTLRSAVSQTVPFPVARPLTRVDDLVCTPDQVIGFGTGTGCVSSATQTVSCLSAAGGAVVTSGDGGVLGAPTPGTVAGSPGAPRSYLAPNDQAGCGQAWTAGALGPGPLSFQPRAYAGNCTVLTVDRLLPLSTGSFALALSSDCAGIPDFPVVQVGPTGAVGGSYIAAPGTAAVKPLVLAALSDGSVVTMRNDPPFTTFESWPVGASSPSRTARVPGLYVYQATPVRLGAGVSAGADGSLSVLLNSATLGDVVLNFGPGLRPLWLYRYPRLAAAAVLVGENTHGLVFYVDPLNNQAVALKRSAGQGTGTVSGVVSSSQGGPLSGVAVTVTPAGGSPLGPVTTDAAGHFSIPGVPSGSGLVRISGVPGNCRIPAALAYTLESAQTTVNVTATCSTGAGTGIYVTNVSPPSITVYDLNATGNAAPVRTLSGTNTGLNVPIGMAFDSAGNLYVANRGNGTVTVFAPGASGNVAPIRTLTATGMLSPESVAIPLTSDEVWVGACPGCGGSSGGATGLFHFPPGGTQSDGQIAGSNTGMTVPGVLVDELGNLVVSNSFGGPFEFFPATARGNVAPSRTFLSVASNAQGVGYGPGLNTLVVADPQRLLFYPGDTASSATPVQPASTISSFPGVTVTFFGGLFLDVADSPPTLYATDQLGAGAFYVMKLSGTPPGYTLQSIRAISGAATGLGNSVGIVVVH